MENNITKENSLISKNFSKSINSIRTLAAIAAINYHIDPKFIFYMTIGPDLFIFLSGLLLTLSYIMKNKKEDSWKKWFKRRFSRIYPILFFSTTIILIYRFITVGRTFQLDEIFIHFSGLQSIPGSPYYLSIDGPHWFITLILTCYLIFPILLKFIKKKFIISIYFSVILYFIYIFFNIVLFETNEEIFFNLYQNWMFFTQILDFIPRYLVFFWGMILGYWIGNDEYKNLLYLQSKKNAILSFLILIISGGLYFIYFYFTFKIENKNQLLFYYYYRVLFQPFVTLGFILLMVFLLNKKKKINSTLKIPGKLSYEIIMIHTIPMILVLYYIPKILYFLEYNLVITLCIVIIFLLSIGLSYPIYFLGKLIKKYEIINLIIISITLSFIIFTVIIYLNLIFIFFEVNNMISLILYSFTSFILFLIITIRWLKKRAK